MSYLTEKEEVQKVLELAKKRNRTVKNAIVHAQSNIFERQARELIDEAKAHPAYTGPEMNDQVYDYAATMISFLQLSAELNHAKRKRGLM